MAPGPQAQFVGKAQALQVDARAQHFVGVGLFAVAVHVPAVRMAGMQFDIGGIDEIGRAHV